MNVELYHDPASHTLVYRHPDPDRITRYVSGAKRLNGEHVAVPITLYNLQLLRWLDLPVVPIMDGYGWPHGPGIPHPYESQKLAANFMVMHPRCFNLSDMGVGKTLAILWAADWLMDQHPKGQCRALIVAPLSILQRVWADAIFKNFLGKRTCQIVHGTQKQRAEALATPADFYIINFDGVGVGAHTRKRFELDGISKHLFERTDIRIGIVDEASAYRDSRTKRHRIARLILGRRDYLWMLTGTPTPNGPPDAYGLAKLVNNAFGKSFTGFQNETMLKLTQFKWVPRHDGYAKARQLLQPSIRFDIKDVWDGPEMTTQQREVPLTDEQRQLMFGLKRDLQVAVRAGPITAANEAAARQKFIQVSLGAVYDQDHKVHYVDASPRLADLRAVIENAPGKILIFAPLTSVVNLLHRELEKDYTVAVVNGEVQQKDRSEIFRAFQQDDSPRIIVADPGTMAHGLDLYAAQTVIWYGPTDKTELYLQACKRAHRPGQRFPVTIVQLVSNRLEAEIFRRLERNETLQGALLQMVREDRL